MFHTKLTWKLAIFPFDHWVEKKFHIGRWLSVQYAGCVLCVCLCVSCPSSHHGSLHHTHLSSSSLLIKASSHLSSKVLREKHNTCTHTYTQHTHTRRHPRTHTQRDKDIYSRDKQQWRADDKFTEGLKERDWGEKQRSDVLHQVQQVLGGQGVLGFRGRRVHHLCLWVRSFPGEQRSDGRRGRGRLRG